MKYDGSNLEEVLKEHEKWMKCNNGERADFAGFVGTALGWKEIKGANLEAANFRGADLGGWGFLDANLQNADFRMASLHWADLKRANLAGADLRGADLEKADLREANLEGAALDGADLTDADLRGAKMPFVPMACPDAGAFIAWKACDSEYGKVIVKLLIPEDAKRSSSTGRKCRADKAVVLEIQSVDGELLDNVVALSMFDEEFCYKVGKTVVPDEPFCEDRFDECASGIHFFVNRQEAVDYYI